MKVSYLRSVVCAVLALVASSAWAEDAKAPQFKFEFHGFVGGSVFAQDAKFDNWGQNVTQVAATPNADRFSFGGDARQTRLNLSLSGPKAFGATPTAVVEFDFLGGNAAGGTFSNVAVTPRLRLAYAQLKWSDTVITVGQNSDLIQGGIAPVSVGHIPTNLGYNHGYIGNRHTGIFAFQTIPLVPDYKLELAVQVSRPQWSDVILGGTTAGDPNSNMSLAEASGLPAVEARVKLLSKIFTTYVSGHWNRVDMSGSGVSPSASGTCPAPAGGATAVPPTNNGSSCQDRDVMAFNGGFKFNYIGITAQGTAYLGKNVAPLNAGIAQFQGANVGDLHSWGAWGQLGYDVTPELSLWYFAGIERLQPREVLRAQEVNGFGTNAGTATVPGTAVAGKFRNVAMSGMIRYMDAGYAIGFEYTHFWTAYVTMPNSTSSLRSPNGDLEGNQYMLSGFYFF